MESGGWVRTVVDGRDRDRWSAIDTSTMPLPLGRAVGNEALVDGARPDWRETVDGCLATFDRISVLLDDPPSHCDLTDLLSMGFRVANDRRPSIAVLDRTDMPLPADQMEFGLVGPLARAVFGDLPGTVPVDARHHGDHDATHLLLADTTPWAAWVRRWDPELATSPPARSVRVISRGAVVRSIRPRIAVDLLGLVPTVIDRVEPRPVVGIVDTGLSAAAVARLRDDLGIVGEVTVRAVRPPGAWWRVGRRPSHRLREAVGDCEAVLLASAAFRSQLDRATFVVVAGAHGVPVIADEPQLMSDYLGPGTLDLISRGSAAVATGGPFLRDAYGVLLHRQVCREHSDAVVSASIVGREFALPSVSVIAVAGPSDRLPGIVESVAAQTVKAELIVVIPDTGGPAPRADRALRVEVLRRSINEPIGASIQAGVAMASGDVVAFWDGDDLFAPTHLEDLVWALRSSRAQVVGKGDEFVHIGALGITVQRSPEHRWSRRHEVGRATALHRSILQEIGGVPAVSRDPQTGLVRRIWRSGGFAFRLHGYGHLVRAVGPTESGIGALLTGSVRQWDGLALAEAGLSDDPVPAMRRYIR